MLPFWNSIQVNPIQLGRACQTGGKFSRFHQGTLWTAAPFADTEFLHKPAFLEQYTGKPYPTGDVLDLFGQVIGHHRGAVQYTTGQRKGLGLATAHNFDLCFYPGLFSRYTGHSASQFGHSAQ